MSNLKLYNYIILMNKPVFFNGPYNIKHEPCIPIHILPPKEQIKQVKNFKPWKPVLPKSNIIFRLDTMPKLVLYRGKN